MAGAEPARKLDDQVYDQDGEQPVTRPDLKLVKNGGEGLSGSPENLSAAEKKPAKSSGDASPEIPDEEKSFYKPESSSPAANSGKSKLGSLLGTRRRKTIFGVGGTATIIGIFLFTFLSGPLEFIHIAQMLTMNHFGHQQDAGDMRMGALYRYMKTGDIGETRLGFLGSHMKTNMLADLEKIGLKPEFGHFTSLQGFEIDTANEESPYKGMSQDEVKAKLGTKGITDGITFDGENAHVSVKGYFKQRVAIKAMVGELGENKLSTAIGGRVLRKYFGVTWHPLKILDNKLNQKLADLYDQWAKNRDTQLSSGEEPGSADVAGAREEGPPDPNTGEPTTKPVDGATEGKISFSSTKAGKILSDIGTSKSLRITGGAAAAVGIVCLVRSMAENIGTVRNTIIIAPLIRMGMDAITVGNQIMSGQDVDMHELSVLSKQFNQLDSKGNVLSSWDQAKPIQAAQGNTGGTDIDPSIKENISGGLPLWLSWTNKVPEVSELCSGVGQAATGIFSITLGILSGGAISTVGGAIASYLVMPGLISKVSHMVAGDAVDVASSGAAWGNAIDYGARLAGNALALASGGVALTTGQVTQLNANQAAENQADFQSKSIAYRIFNPTDYRSALSKVIDNTSPSVTQNIAKMGTGLLNFGHIFSSIPKLFAGTAHANALVPYDYGFKEYGFSDADLNDPAVSDPYANADKAAALLNNDSTYGYTAKAQKCFGVTIANAPDEDGTSRWQVTHDQTNAPNPYDPDTGHYNNNDCIDAGNSNWKVIRFFILDSDTMASYACYNGDDQACSDVGYDSSSTTSATVSSSAAPLTSLNGHQLSATQSKWIKYIADNVVQLLPGNSSEQAAMAARVTWWSLKEGVLSLDNPLNYSNCGAGSDHRIAITATCPSGSAWQVGIAGVQPPSFSLSEVETVAQARHPGMSLKDILAEVAKSAGYANGSATYNTIVNSSGDLRKSLLLQDPATGFTFVDGPIQSGCINTTPWTNWCDVSSDFAPNQQVALMVINDLTAYFSGSSGSVASGTAQQLAQQILNNNNIDLKSYRTSVFDDVQAAAAGKPGTAGAMTSSTILQLIANVGKNHKVLVTAIQSNGQGHCNNTPKSGCPDDPHYNGDAVDFGSLDGHALIGRDQYSVEIIKLAESILPHGSRFGQDPKANSSCGTDIALAPGFSEVADTCNHLHVDVPKGTP
jgi:hypothetical protein